MFVSPNISKVRGSKSHTSCDRLFLFLLLLKCHLPSFFLSHKLFFFSLLFYLIIFLFFFVVSLFFFFLLTLYSCSPPFPSGFYRPLIILIRVKMLLGSSRSFRNLLLIIIKMDMFNFKPIVS